MVVAAGVSQLEQRVSELDLQDLGQCLVTTDHKCCTVTWVHSSEVCLIGMASSVDNSTS